MKSVAQGFGRHPIDFINSMNRYTQNPCHGSHHIKVSLRRSTRIYENCVFITSTISRSATLKLLTHVFNTSILRHVVSSTLLNRIALRSCHTKLWVTSWHRLYKICHTAFFDHTKIDHVPWYQLYKVDALRFDHTKLGVILFQQSNRRSVISTTPRDL